AEPKIVKLTPNGRSGRRSNSGAAAFSADGRTLYWGSGDDGQVYVFDVVGAIQRTSISLNVQTSGLGFKDSFVMDMQLSAVGKYLYCADVTNFRVAIIDLAVRKVISSIRVGRYPYALAILGKRVYVTNIGMFEYSPIPPPSDSKYDKRGITFPAFGFPSKEAREGVEHEGRKIAGLGDPNVRESFSVLGVDVSSPSKPRVVQ